MLVGDAATISTDKTLGSLYDYACEHGRVVFVEQLLSEEGVVPPDPSAVTLPQLKPKAANKFKQARETRQDKLKDEVEVRQRIEKELKTLSGWAEGISLIAQPIRTRSRPRRRC